VVAVEELRAYHQTRLTAFLWYKRLWN
jgi:hypothetical protein